MFNQKKAKPENIRYLKEVISKKLNLPETTILSIANLVVMNLIVLQKRQ